MLIAWIQQSLVKIDDIIKEKIPPLSLVPWNNTPLSAAVGIRVHFMNLSAAKLAYLLVEMAHSTAGVYAQPPRVGPGIWYFVSEDENKGCKMRNATARSASQISARSAGFSLSLVTTSGDNLPEMLLKFRFLHLIPWAFVNVSARERPFSRRRGSQVHDLFLYRWKRVLMQRVHLSPQRCVMRVNAKFSNNCCR